MTRIFIIKTAETEKIKSLLDHEHINYQVVADEVIKDQNLTEEEIWRRDARLANQDQELNKEIKEWDKITRKIDDE